MIPVSLKLRNFMAYQEAELDFQGFHLAALTGPNGSGKSSLLDAMTWALWGKARAKDDALIRLGEQDMEVEYTFGLHDNVHRVIRKRSSKGRGRSSLSFQVESDLGWRDLSEGGKHKTQRKIDNVLRLDYDTFINSAFLLQGKDNEFTVKTSGQRKEILSNILGLGIYDLYADRARERVKLAKTEVAVYEAKIKQIEDELAQKGDYKAELKQAQQDVTELSQQRELADKEVQLLYEQHRAITDKQRQLETAQQRLREDNQDLNHTQQEVKRSTATINQFEAIIAQQPDIEAGVARLAKARVAVEDWEHRLHEMTQLNQQQHELEQVINKAEAKLQTDIQAMTTTINLLSPKVALITQHRQTLQQVEAELAILTQLQTTQQQHQTALPQLASQIGTLEAQQTQITDEGKTLNGKMAELQQAGAFCPVCKTALNDAHRATAIAQFESEIEAKRDVFRGNKQRVNELMAEQTQHEQAIAEAKAQLARLPRVQGQVASLKQSIAEADQATAKLQEASKHQQQLQNQLQERTFAESARQALAKLQQQLQTVSYNRTAHEQAKTEVQETLQFETLARKLAEARQHLPDEQSRLAQYQARLTRLQQQIDSNNALVEQLQQETTMLPQLKDNLALAQTNAAQLQIKERRARDRVAAAKQHLAYMDKLAEQRAEHTEQLTQAQKELAIYQELQAAFGKKGVQALLIESAIPEIETEANHLLSRMTDGRMHVRFETQRETKKGDTVIETLDIQIADELGTRDYNLFSGGEAFRINFAIRIAISRVLARRAGAQLQTLIIDEGFGSQDGPGRERLVEAINRIQDDFEKVIVITHVEELKDAFPVRIEIEKQAEGSQLLVRGI